MNILTELSLALARSTKSLFVDLSLERDSRGIFVIPSSVPLIRGRGPRKSNRPESHHVPRCNHGYPAPDPRLIIIYVSYSAALHIPLPSFTNPLLRLIPCRRWLDYVVTYCRCNFSLRQRERLVTMKRLREKGTTRLCIVTSFLYTQPLLLRLTEVFVRYPPPKILHP